MKTRFVHSEASGVAEGRECMVIEVEHLRFLAV